MLCFWTLLAILLQTAVRHLWRGYEIKGALEALDFASCIETGALRFEPSNATSLSLFHGDANSVFCGLQSTSIWADVVLGRQYSHCQFVLPSQNPPDQRWRKDYLGTVLSAIYGASVPDRDIYNFGVLYGFSMKVLRDVLPMHRLIGFDSFQGLPAESTATKPISIFTEGGMNMTDTGNIEGALTHILGGPHLNKFVKGFYNESLRPQLVEDLHLKPALYIDLDCDLYISTLQALDFMFGSGLVVPGTLIGYDDWFEGTLRNGLQDGELRWDSGQPQAHLEITEKYGVTFKCAAGACTMPAEGFFEGCSVHNSLRPIFIVASIGGRSHSTGWDTPTAQLLARTEGREDIPGTLNGDLMKHLNRLEKEFNIDTKARCF